MAWALFDPASAVFCVGVAGPAWAGELSETEGGGAGTGDWPAGGRFPAVVAVGAAALRGVTPEGAR